MKILILCSVVPKKIEEQIKMECGHSEGWVSSVLSEIEKEDNLNVCVCFPLPSGLEQKEYQLGNSIYYGFTIQHISPIKYDASVEKQFKIVLEKENPDIVHIFGTEFPHTFAMVKAFNKPERTVIHIQGLVSVCARHYCGFLPPKAIKKSTFRDYIRHDNIAQQKRKFEIRGEFEMQALKRTCHVMGRTDWDESCCKWINPNVTYHYVQEAMRPEFYEGEWSYDGCEKHSLFMSQGGYPVKGLHLALEALHILKAKYDDVKLYIAGIDIIHYNGFKQKIRKTYYAKYIMELVKKWNLCDSVIFLGPLNSEEMKMRYLSSHVFISPSVIENSPNSIGEAMMLGIPIVASDVGGVSSLIDHKQNGFLYQADAPYMLAYYVGELFEKRRLTEEMSRVERQRASVMYDRAAILKQLLNTYIRMTEREKEEQG